MPDIPAFFPAYFKFLINVFGYIRRPFKQTTEACTCPAAGFIVRIAGDYDGFLSGKTDFMFNQPACTVGKVLPAKGRIDVISDVAVIVYASAFSIPVTDLSDLLPLVMQGDLPDLFMSKTEFPVRCADMDRNQVDNAVGILGPVVSEKHRSFYTSCTLTWSSTALMRGESTF